LVLCERCHRHCVNTLCRIVMTSLEGKDFTVAELKDALRERKLATGSTKTELIFRLVTADPNIWTIMSERQNQTSRTEDASTFDSIRETVDDPVGPEDGASAVHEMRQLRLEEPDRVSHELELIRRERELIERERQLLRREREIAYNASVSSNVTHAASDAHKLKDLLPEFDATENTGDGNIN